ncbi:hypothetical protein LRS11_16910 [Pseudomonas sp. J452]|jgi:hypothetical protein|uniref:hypothetical protein n=1 Tax=Pseudomonas sp. J452 TaxID=2898441 RepID=UPI0021AD58AF|nr:hypothetical protein [Pseudomonas sp. J452]UUY07493.1 hypothetical protein LRS11_16910 [Pseudomonas sp. J452]
MPTKDELREILARQAGEFQHAGGEVVLYAAKSEPTKKPWKKRPSLLDEAFRRELEKSEKELRDKECP